MRLLTIIESPFAGKQSGAEWRVENVKYLNRCLFDSMIIRGELPFASHGFFPAFLDEDDPKDRQMGIEAGYDFWRFASKIAFYLDMGMTPGMARAFDRARAENLPIDERRIGL